MPLWYLQYRFQAAESNFEALADYDALTTVVSRACTAVSRNIYIGKLRMLLAVALEQDRLVAGDRAARILFCPAGSLRLLHFFNRMMDEGMNPSTRQNYHRALKSVGDAVRGKDHLIQTTPDLARAADSLLERHLATYLSRCDNDRSRVIGEQRAEPEFEERDIRMSLTEHEEFWHLNLIELRRLQGAVDMTTSRWRVTYFLRLVVFLHYIPLRRSFWAQMHNGGVILDPQGQRYLALPHLEKSNHLKRGPRNYYQVAQEHTDVLHWYIHHGRALLRGRRAPLDAPSDPFLLNDKGEPIQIDNITDIVRKFLYECTGIKMKLRTYRFLFAMAIMSSDDMEEAHKLFLTQQLRHSKATHDR